ncbi:MAG TPA: glycosyltransferase [Candidatus Paceibacterota bacterium]|nr:glycosyltransferase [Candidatus Paceibacterota bacterium]
MSGGIDLWVVYGFLFISMYFEVFLLTSFIERRFRSKPIVSPGGNPLPKVAIVVPCFNEEKSLSSTVQSLLALDYPADKFEIFIVDDGSTDGTLALAKTFENAGRKESRVFFGEDCLSDQDASSADEKNTRLFPLVRVFHKENGGKHTAMNLALAHTNAELIGCLDADSIVEPSALRAIVPVFDNATVAAATPGIHVKNPSNLLQHMQHVEYRLSIFNRFMLAGLGSAFITPGPFSFFRAQVVRDLGSWRDGHSTEDMEMALRMQQGGFLIANVPSAIVHTGAPKTLRGLYRQRVRWTYGWLRNAIDYKHMFGNRAYGNLGIIILPSAIISIFAGIYFFARIVFYTVRELIAMVERIMETGIYPHTSFDLFYFNTSALWFLIFMSVGLVFALLCAGTMIGTEGRRFPPKATPLFLLFYSFLVPLWLSAAVVRAAFKTGVRWR